MTQQIGPVGVFNPNAQSIGSGVSNPSGASGPVVLSAWPMNEGSGLTLNDSAGSNTATISGASAIVWQANAGFPGTTPTWQGLGNALATSTSLTNFDGTTPFTVSAWFGIGGPGAGTLFGTCNALSGTFQGWELNSGAGGTVAFILANTITTNWILKLGLLTATPGAANYAVVTYDGSKTAAGVKIYLNGVLDSGATVGADNLTGSTANGLPVRFAARNDATSEYLGAEAFCEVYSGVLSGATIAANFALGPGIH